MNKNEAAEILALELKVWARKHGMFILSMDANNRKNLIEERMSELMFNGTGLHRAAAQARPHYRTVLIAYTRIAD